MSILFTDKVPHIARTNGVAVVTFGSGDDQFAFAMTPHTFALIAEEFRRDMVRAETAQIVPFSQAERSKSGTAK